MLAFPENAAAFAVAVEAAVVVEGAVAVEGAVETAQIQDCMLAFLENAAVFAVAVGAASWHVRNIVGLVAVENV